MSYGRGAYVWIGELQKNFFNFPLATIKVFSRLENQRAVLDRFTFMKRYRTMVLCLTGPCKILYMGNYISNV